jgi:uncharacterized protein with PQ loop repeat
MEIIWVLTILSMIALQGSSIPQFIRNFKRKSTEDISITLWVMVLIGYIFLLIVAFMIENKQFLLIYSLGSINIAALLTQIIYYRRNLK